MIIAAGLCELGVGVIEIISHLPSYKAWLDESFSSHAST